MSAVSAARGPHDAPVVGQDDGVVDDICVVASGGVPDGSSDEVFGAAGPTHAAEPGNSHLVAGGEDELGIVSVALLGEERAHEVEPLGQVCVRVGVPGRVPQSVGHFTLGSGGQSGRPLVAAQALEELGVPLGPRVVLDRRDHGGRHVQVVLGDPYQVGLGEHGCDVAAAEDVEDDAVVFPGRSLQLMRDTLGDGVDAEERDVVDRVGVLGADACQVVEDLLPQRVALHGARDDRRARRGRGGEPGGVGQFVRNAGRVRLGVPLLVAARAYRPGRDQDARADAPTSDAGHDLLELVMLVARGHLAELEGDEGLGLRDRFRH